MLPVFFSIDIMDVLKEIDLQEVQYGVNYPLNPKRFFNWDTGYSAVMFGDYFNPRFRISIGSNNVTTFRYGYLANGTIREIGATTSGIISFSREALESYFDRGATFLVFYPSNPS